MKICPVAQREPREWFMDQIAEEFDAEKFGYPVLSHRDGCYYLVDGQHRIGALRRMGWSDQLVQCEVYEGLTEKQEADLFLARNNRLNVPAIDSFLVAVTAERGDALRIQQTVRAQGMTVGHHDGSIRAVAALRTVDKAGGAVVLGRSLRIIRDSFGPETADGPLIRGMGALCQRYNGQLDEAEVVQVLSQLPRGVHGLRQHAEGLRQSTGWPANVCLAAAVVEIVNATRPRTRKLPPWAKANGAVPKADPK